MWISSNSFLFLRLLSWKSPLPRFIVNGCRGVGGGGTGWKIQYGASKLDYMTLCLHFHFNLSCKCEDWPRIGHLIHIAWDWTEFSSTPPFFITSLNVLTILGQFIAIQIKIGKWQLAYYFIQNRHSTRLVTTWVLFDLELYLKTAYQVIKQRRIPLYSRCFKELRC